MLYKNLQKKALRIFSVHQASLITFWLKYLKSTVNRYDYFLQPASKGKCQIKPVIKEKCIKYSMHLDATSSPKNISKSSYNNLNSFTINGITKTQMVGGLEFIIFNTN